MLRRGAEHCVITLSKAGYADRTLTFTRVLSHTAWVNFVPGFVLGLASGAAVAIGTAFDDSGRSNARPNEAALGGIVVGTGVGLLVDRSTGAIFRQVPSSVDVALEPRP